MPASPMLSRILSATTIVRLIPLVSASTVSDSELRGNTAMALSSQQSMSKGAIAKLEQEVDGLIARTAELEDENARLRQMLNEKDGLIAELTGKKEDVAQGNSKEIGPERKREILETFKKILSYYGSKFTNREIMDVNVLLTSLLSGGDTQSESEEVAVYLLINIEMLQKSDVPDRDMMICTVKSIIRGLPRGGNLPEEKSAEIIAKLHLDMFSKLELRVEEASQSSPILS